MTSSLIWKAVKVMSRIEELIKEKCPNGVDFYSIGEVCTVVRGASPRPIKNFITEDVDGVNWIKIGDVAVGSKYITSCAERITREGARKSRYVKKGDFILSNSMSFGRPYILEIDGCIHDGWLAISDFEDKMIADYLYYILTSGNIQREMEHRASFGGAVQNLNADIVRAIEIPVPPIEVQQEIVRILDKFIELEAELRAELDVRKKQYEYYRDNLMDIDDKYPMVKLEDLCTLITKQTGFDYSNSIKPTLVTEAGEERYSFIQNKDFEGNRINFDTDYYVPIEVAKRFPKIILDTPSLLISLSGKVGNIGYYDLPQCAFIGGAVGICKLKNDVYGKYIMHYLMSYHGRKYLFQSVKAASHINLTVESVRNALIPIPPIEVQRSISEMLDKFATLCHHEKNGLPAEITFRKKQYEYYRDKLLTFERKVV